jgi:hypothetical protein
VKRPPQVTAIESLSIPGRHESRALADCCRDVRCLDITEPTAVLDLPDRAGRVAAYRCRVCGERWFCSWAAP